MPIFRYDNIKSNTDLTMVPKSVAFILSTLLPIASRLNDKGACIYWNRQNGAKNLK